MLIASNITNDVIRILLIQLDSYKYNIVLRIFYNTTIPKAITKDTGINTNTNTIDRSAEVEY